uniref:Uncharacterized protein n=1 Tax=Lactuca sativa TaxID=4236 RepID=A0A9R1V0A9_LACSA|nr:hypothetical protein LSAT_V11C700378820 [Lactuca sativa]
MDINEGRGDDSDGTKNDRNTNIISRDTRNTPNKNRYGNLEMKADDLEGEDLELFQAMKESVRAKRRRRGGMFSGKYPMLVVVECDADVTPTTYVVKELEKYINVYWVP